VVGVGGCVGCVTGVVGGTVVVCVLLFRSVMRVMVVFALLLSVLVLVVV